MVNFGKITKNLPKIGDSAPTNMSAEQQQLRVMGEAGDKIKHILDELEQDLETHGYLNMINGCAKFLQEKISEAGLKNKEVPLIWQVFRQRYQDKLSKLSPTEQEKAPEFEIFSPVWNTMSKEHNAKLQEFPFAGFYGQDK